MSFASEDSARQRQMACARIQKDDPYGYRPVLLIFKFVTDRLNIDQFASVPGQRHHDMRMRTICEDVMAASRRTPDVSNK
ncbi:hypothetical protein [Bradyrhizobium sp. AC87j1]|uniref:hypothetical protein n=1 Tax=Bradyrhizobium sp. AC87j1 TaxID=2055894 RepID=UPI00191BD8CC|nr:hypothetical protein [Bradyrhizobium sp. AC87j1]